MLFKEILTPNKNRQKPNRAQRRARAQEKARRARQATRDWDRQQRAHKESDEKGDD